MEEASHYRDWMAGLSSAFFTATILSNTFLVPDMLQKHLSPYLGVEPSEFLARSILHFLKTVQRHYWPGESHTIRATTKLCAGNSQSWSYGTPCFWKASENPKLLPWWNGSKTFSLYMRGQNVRRSPIKPGKENRGGISLESNIIISRISPFFQSSSEL